MPEYIFQLGNHPDLSLREITSVFPYLEKKHALGQEFFLFSSSKEIPEENAQKLFNALGGSIRLAKILEREPTPESIAEYLHEKVPEGKIHFALSFFPEKKETKKWLFRIKELLKKQERSIRFLNRNFQNIDSGAAYKEGVSRKEKRIEILIGENFIAQTLGVQHVEAFARRDFKKPVRDMQVGMLPPKLALMMVNFARKEGNPPSRIWDPFCGTGTILVEGKYLGSEVFGSDISPDMISASKQNLQHFFYDFPLDHILLHDARTPLPSSQQKEITIVSEGFLGPIFRNPLHPTDLEKARGAVEPIMSDFLHASARNPHIQNMVLSLPFWKMKSGENAFCEKTLATAAKFWKNALASNDQKFLFRRENQVVGRHVLILEK